MPSSEFIGHIGCLEYRKDAITLLMRFNYPGKKDRARPRAENPPPNGMGNVIYGRAHRRVISPSMLLSQFDVQDLLGLRLAEQ